MLAKHFRAIIILGYLIAINGEKRKFPENFSFGVASASYQIEGAWNVSDKGENIWDRLVHTTDMVSDGDTGDDACLSYYLYNRDAEMVDEMGLDFYRFSLSWSRLLPTGFSNKISEDGVRYYNDLIDSLLARNIQPYITLYHWDLPQSLQDLGGWTNPAMVDYFYDYAQVAFSLFGDRVKSWLTFNEPYVFCVEGYEYQNKAPALGMKGIGAYLCGHTVLKAHAKAYKLYDQIFRPVQKGRISLTLSLTWAEPGGDSIEDIEASERFLQFEGGWFANPVFSKTGDYPSTMKEYVAKMSETQGYPRSRLPEFTPDEVEYIKGTYDFFGVNHYTTYMVKDNPDPNWEQSIDSDKQGYVYSLPEWPGSASNWLKVVPWGFTKLLGWIRERYDNPEVMIFENGFSDIDGLDDQDRVDYYKMYLNALLDAVDEGSNVTTYTAWSLMDNFEWEKGYRERFGLYYVDYKSANRTRTPKSSAKFYKDVANDRSIDSLDKFTNVKHDFVNSQ